MNKDISQKEIPLLEGYLEVSPEKYVLYEISDTAQVRIEAYLPRFFVKKGAQTREDIRELQDDAFRKHVCNKLKSSIESGVVGRIRDTYTLYLKCKLESIPELEELLRRRK